MKPRITKNFVKVSARNAKEIFESKEKALYICASKMNPDNRDYVEEITSNMNSFEDVVRKYSEEKCSYKAGKYPAFFILKGKRRCN